MGICRPIGGLQRSALVAFLIAAVLSGGVAAANGSTAAAPTLAKVRAKTLVGAGPRTSWVLTASVADLDNDLIGGQVKLRIGAKGAVLSHRIVGVKARSTSARGVARPGSGVSSATLSGRSLRVVFFASPAPGPLTVTFWVSDTARHASLRVALHLKVKATQTVIVVATSPAAAEPDRAATLTVTRAGGSTATPLTVFYTVTGTATPASDYATLPGSVTLPAGAATAAITVDPVDDETIESPESVIVVITANPGYLVGTTKSATATIASDDVAPSVSITASDPAAGEVSNPGSFTVRRSGSTTTALIVSYTAAGTATAVTDYAALPGSVTIPAGESDATIAVSPVNDTLVESAETVVVTLRASSRYTIDSSGDATVTIADDDSVASVTVAPTASAAEPSSPGAFTVTRTGSTSAALTVAFTLGGTATPGTDYSTAPASPLTIPAGSASATINVTPIDDTIVESNEAVVVTLAAGSDYTVGAMNSASVSITDDEPTVTISASDATAAEPADTGTFTLTRTGSTTAPLTVFYTVSGTATNGSDYTALAGSVTIPAGQASVTVTVSPINDALVEGPETVVLTLVATSGNSVGSPGSDTVTIADND